MACAQHERVGYRISKFAIKCHNQKGCASKKFADSEEIKDDTVYEVFFLLRHGPILYNRKAAEAYTTGRGLKVFPFISFYLFYQFGVPGRGKKFTLYVCLLE
jgi:hypothetical protein